MVPILVMVHLPVVVLGPPPPPQWAPAIEAYRAMLVRKNRRKAVAADVPEWAKTTRALREWMQQHDPDYPLFHLAAPRGLE